MNLTTFYCLVVGFGTFLATANDPHRLLGSSFGIPGDNASFDYVIVGGGNAGLAIAARLAEQQQNVRVAVVEAGSFYEIGNGNLSEIPAFDSAFTSKGVDDWQPLVDWGYITTPQTSAYNVEMHYARGKCLGGTTARNYLVYQRGTVASYQNWADQVGDQSYTFDRLLPFFKKTTKFTPPNMDIRFANATPEYNETVLGNDGPVSISYTNYAQAFATWTTEGLLAMGIPIIKGFQAGSLLGQSYTMLAINPTTMTRVSSETSFMRKALEYPNLTVYQSTMAKRVLFNANKKATGVLVDTQGKKFTLTATKEVIISAGVFGSPHLLLVSGVGPAATLEEFEIPVIADLPGVGQNMQDHIYFGPSYRVNAPTMSSLQNPDFAADAAREFNEKAAGMYANPTVDTLGWEKIPEPLRSSTFSAETRFVLDQYPADWPEVEYFSLSTYLGYQYKSRGGDPNDGYNYASLGAAITMPRSRGNITITSADNAVHPVINPNFLSDRADIEVSIAAFKRLRQFWNSTALEPFLADPNESFPGLNVSTDAQMEDIIRKSFNTVFHAACTCSMGPSADRLAVVDPQARVYGVQSLRIVDASIFPFLPPGHPMATVYALAEKIAYEIYSANGYRGSAEANTSRNEYI